MQKLETRNGTLYFSESPETIPLSYYYHDGYDIVGEVTKEAVAFSPESFIEEYYKESIIKPEYYLRRAMVMNGIELREGFKFIVLKEK